MRNQRPKQREIVLVLGKTGTGKSTYMMHHVAAEPRTLILDPLGEYPGVEYEDVLDMLDDCAGQERFRARTESVLDLDDLARIAFALKNVSLVVDEAQRSMPQSGRDLPPAVEDIIYRGRHANVSLYLVAQRPTTVHIAPRSQWTRIISFNQSEVSDVSWIESTSGYSLDRIRTLSVGEYIEITPSGFEFKRTKPFHGKLSADDRDPRTEARGKAIGKFTLFTTGKEGGMER